MNTAQIYHSGSVRRYHANPWLAMLGQTNADHQGRVVQLILMLHPSPSIALLRAAAFHDAGEVVAGDLPGPFKRANVLLAELHHQAEAVALAEMGLAGIYDDLTVADAEWLQLVDRLEAWAHTATHAPQIAARRDWRAQRQEIAVAALRLGARADVLEFMAAIEAAHE